MISYLRLIKTVLLHKWYVFRAGRRLKVPFWRLVVHDLSKFSPAEFAAYARNFYGDRSDPHGFDRAWLHHQNHNDHHWEYWAARDGNVELLAVNTPKGPALVRDQGPMPFDSIPITVPSVTVSCMSIECVREMIADWFAAGKAYNGAWPNPADYTWYKQNRPRMHLHPGTEVFIHEVLAQAASCHW
jgi:hypothetical protein